MIYPDKMKRGMLLLFADVDDLKKINDSFGHQEGDLALIDTANRKETRRYELSISIGIVQYNPEQPCSIDELLAQADKIMYEQKQNKNSGQE